MALPTLSKTWQFNVNNQNAAQGSVILCNRRLLMSLKNALIGFGSSPWVVRGSSNSVAGAMDSVDRWVTDSNLIWANDGVAHAWIVLRQTGLATNAELLISCNQAAVNGNQATITFSPSAGFTGGSNTTNPTATDAFACIANTNFGAVTADIAIRWSVMQSTDGQCTRILVYQAGSPLMFYVFDKATNVGSGWTNPVVVATQPNTSPALLVMSSRVSPTLIATISMGAETVQGATVANELSGDWPMIPIGLSSATVGARGRHGSLFDIWQASNSLVTGDTYPGDGSAQFAQFGTIILPWNGGPVNLS